MKNWGIWAGLGRDFADFWDFSRNDPKWFPRALGLLFGGLGGPWDYYLGVWGPKITLKISSVYRLPEGARCTTLRFQSALPSDNEH